MNYCLVTHYSNEKPSQFSVLFLNAIYFNLFILSQEKYSHCSRFVFSSSVTSTTLRSLHFIYVLVAAIAKSVWYNQLITQQLEVKPYLLCGLARSMLATNS